MPETIDSTAFEPALKLFQKHNDSVVKHPSTALLKAFAKKSLTYNFLTVQNTDGIFTDRWSKKIDRSLRAGDSLLKIPGSFLNRFSYLRQFGKLTAGFKDSLLKLNSFLKSFSETTFKNPVVFNNSTAIYSGISDSSYLRDNAQYYAGDFDFKSDWSIGGIPLILNYKNQNWNETEGRSINVFSFEFDKDAYIQNLKSKLKSTVDPAALMNIKNPFESLKQNAEQALQNELNTINTSYGQLLNNKLAQLGNLKDLFAKDIMSLREQLMSNEFVQGIRAKENLFAELQHKIDIGQPVNMEEFNSIKNSLVELKGVQEVIAKIDAHKKKWESSGLIKKMKEWDLLQKQKLLKLAGDPSHIKKMAREQLNLSSLQRLFLKINKLNIGQDAFSSSPLSMQHFLNNGVVAELMNKGKSILLLTGKQQDFNSIRDMPFVNNIFSNTGTAKAIQLGLGNTGISKSNISVMSFSRSLSPDNNGLGLQVLNSFRQSLVTTISNEMNIGEKGIITAEISRSAMSQNFNKGDSAGQGKSSFEKILSSDDFFKNMAFSLKYKDEFSKAGLSYQIEINRTANGYENPGNQFLNSGSKELGLQMRKSFLKKKIQLSLRSNVREFKYNDELDMKWRNFYMLFDAKWKMKKGQYIGIRYQPNKMTRIEDGNKFTATAIERLAVEANLAKKIAGYYYRNYMNLSYQKNKYAFGTSPVLNKSLLFSSYQTFAINKKLIYVNTSYNYSNSRNQYIYFNTSLVTEAGTSYQLFKGISGSSGITYNSVAGWYQQAGIRQSLSGQLNEKLNLSIYVDARRNIKLIQPVLFGLVRADVSVQYSFNKN